MKTVQLSNGVKMPMEGFGVFQIPEENCEQAVRDAVSVGYRLFDTASSYQNEKAVDRSDPGHDKAEPAGGKHRRSQCALYTG